MHGKGKRTAKKNGPRQNVVINSIIYFVVVNPHQKTSFPVLFRESERERGRKGRRARERSIDVIASCTPRPEECTCNPGTCSWWGIEPETLWCTGPMLQPLKHTSQGKFYHFFINYLIYQETPSYYFQHLSSLVPLNNDTFWELSWGNCAVRSQRACTHLDGVAYCTPRLSSIPSSYMWSTLDQNVITSRETVFQNTKTLG